jgi:ABC-2 type transport system ATP-binding protein
MTVGQQDRVIEARALVKRFRAGTSAADLLRGRLRGREIVALSGLELGVARGECVAVVGENGAGKSTLLRLIAALLLPDSGALRVLDCDVGTVDAGFRRRVCYVVAEERSFSWRLTGEQNLAFFAALYGLRGAAARARVGQALEIAELRSAARRPVREYSTGMRSRLAFARALLGEPELWLFDEPTRGVDPLAAARLRRFIRDELLARRGGTAVVATHDLGEVQALCTRAVALTAGRVVGEAAPDGVGRLLGTEAS